MSIELHELLAVARKHNVVPNGINIGGDDIEEAWQDGQLYADAARRGVAWSYLEQVNLAAERLALLPTVKAIETSTDSYFLKHLLEGWNADRDYICNGATIVAAYVLGLPIWYEPGWGPNVRIGVSRRRSQRVRDENRERSRSCQIPAQ